MIYTFYSYKGGVGRSMALANVAELLYAQGLKVLMIDWDLEAPGLERYFGVEIETVLKQPGVADMVQDYKRLLATPRLSAGSEMRLELPEMGPYILAIYPGGQPPRGAGELWLMPAGKRAGDEFNRYGTFVRTFDWEDFYQNWEGEAFIEWFRRQVTDFADAVLIDSRTGVTEMGGICTYQLSDVVVMFCAPNAQSMDGTDRMAMSFKDPEVAKLRRDRPLNVIIVPARVEDRAEKRDLSMFQAEFLDRFGRHRFSGPRALAATSEAMWKLRIPHVPYYAFREAVVARDPKDIRHPDMYEAFQQLAALLHETEAGEVELLRAMQSELQTSLPQYLTSQRWFSGRGRRLLRVQVQLMAALSGGSPALVEVIVAASYADGGVERYQVPCGLWTGEEGPSFAATHPEAQIGSFEWSGRRAIIYDAVYDPDLGPLLLELLAQESRIDELNFYLYPLEIDFPSELRANASRLLSGEQTNSSLVYDDRFILKLFRRLHDGENPELEIPKVLAAAGFTAIAKPLGWIDGPGATLAVLQRYYPGSATGWEVAVGSVAEAFDAPDRELSSLENDFAPHASHLGTLTADLHIALAEVLDTVIAEEADLAQTNQQMRAHLYQVISEVPALEPYRSEIEELLTAMEKTATRLRLQRIHGDYHLNQVLRTVDGDWLAIDFEGEPVRSLEERRGLSTPLRDVAGMLRSFDYVASYPLLERPDLAGLEQRARDWTTRNQVAFLDSYVERAGPAGLLPDAYGLVLLANEVDKAVYEVRYEARYRPTSQPIPLQGIQRLLANFRNSANAT